MDETLETSEFGTLQLDPRTHWYEGRHDIPFFRTDCLCIAAEDVEDGLPALREFLDWIRNHYKHFMLRVEFAIGNNDLIWDDVWDSILGEDWAERWDENPGMLLDHLRLDSIDYYEGHIHVWVDTSGLHGDHLIHAHIRHDGNWDVDYCEI